MLYDGYELNRLVFKDTRVKSNTIFSKATKDAIKKSVVIKNPEKIRIGKRTKQMMEIEFFDGGTVEATVNNHGNTAILNFADALVAGGLVEMGEFTQEENICRCSNLYETLLKSKNQKDYYEYNHRFGSIYSDRIIYSRDVTVFKDDTMYEDLERPYKIDVITCPAPSSSNTPKNIIYKRVEGIIKAGVKMGKDTIVLGMWGCGAFGQNPMTVAYAFSTALKKYPYFKKVIFAIRPTYNVKSIDPMSEAFKQAFWLDYEMED